MNNTNPGFLKTFLWVNFSAIMFFIAVWLLQIGMWIYYIENKLRINKQKKYAANQYTRANDNTVKNLEVEEWKLKLMKGISICEIIALILGGITICIHRIISFYNHILQVEIALTYLHDFLYLNCLYQVWLVLRLLNSLVKYLRGVCDWHEHKPDAIKHALHTIKTVSIIFIPTSGLWVIAVPLGFALVLCITYEYIQHIKYSRELYNALKRVAKDYCLKYTADGRALYKVKQQEKRSYGIFATFIIIGTFFWISPTGLSILQVAMHQLRFVARVQGCQIEFLEYLFMFKIYLMALKDFLLVVGGCFLFSIHICFTFSHFKLIKFNLCCIRKVYRKSDLYLPLV